MRIEQAAGSRAAQALLAHIRELYGTIPAFSTAKGLDRLKVQKVINGTIKRIDVPFALDIERATDGKVPVPWWAEAATPETTGEVA